MSGEEEMLAGEEKGEQGAGIRKNSLPNMENGENLQIMPFSDENIEVFKYQPLDPKVIVEMPTLEEIKALMKCGSCMRIPLMEAFVCSNDHLICRKCLSIAKNVGMVCPVALQSSTEICKAELSDAKLGPLSKIFQISKYKCPSAQCEVTSLSGIEMDEHTQVCKFRCLVQCSEMACKQERIPVVSYVSHLKARHNVPVFEGPCSPNFIVTLPFSKDRRNENWPIAILEAHRQQFVILIEHNTDHFTFAAFLLDSRTQSPNKHAHFQVQFEIKSASPAADKDQLSESIKWIGPIYPFLQESDDDGHDEDDKDLLQLIIDVASNSKPKICFQLSKDYVYYVNPQPRPAPYIINLSVTIFKRFSFKETPQFRKFCIQFP